MTSLLAASLSAAQTKLYVAWYGNDAWSGSQASINGTKGPKATIAGARDAIQALKATGQLSPAGAIVELEDGEYDVRTPLEFYAQDSGTPGGPIVYRAAHAHRAMLTGSIRVSGWSTPNANLLGRVRPEARPFVVAADLGALGISSVGSLARCHWSGDMEDQPSMYDELYVNGSRQTIARWPNSGYARMTGAVDRSTFQADLSTSRISANPNVDIYSFPTFDWGFISGPATVNRDAGTVTYALPQSNDFKIGGRFFLRDSLEELDAPGEYYVDPATLTVLYYPYPGQGGFEARVACNVERALIRMVGVSNVSFEGIDMMYGRGDGLDIVGCSNISLTGMRVSKLGGYAVRFYSCTDGTVDSCVLDDLGEGGVRMDGCGDYQTLTPGNVVVQNCRISDFGILAPSYRPGVFLTGVGNKALHNDILRGPHEAIHIQGNGLVVSGNYISTFCTDTSDAGAIYASGTVVDRGTVISRNVIENVKNRIDNGGIWAIYLDSRMSGVTVAGNVVRQADYGLLLNGGRNNTVANNAFLDCGYALQFNDLSNVDYSDLVSALTSVPFQSGRWAQRYPELGIIQNDDPTYPKYNLFARNTVVRCSQVDIWNSGVMQKWGILDPVGKLQVGWFYDEPSAASAFVNEAAGDLCPITGSFLSNIGFAELHEGDAGVQTNGYIQGRTP